MTWTPDRPDDFTQFVATDMPAFLAWWESQYSNLTALELVSAFIEGIVDPYLVLLQQGETLPQWIRSLLETRLMAQWAYEIGLPLASRATRGLEAIASDPAEYAGRFNVTPADIAAVPPEVRQAFLEGAKFSLSWVDRLSGDARSLIGDVLAAHKLVNQNPQAAVPILEQILRRDVVAKELGIAADRVTPQQIKAWIEAAQHHVLKAVADRAMLISQTETMRMMNLGALTAMEQKGDRLCYVMPHAGSCPDCQRLLDGRVFPVSVLKANLFKNFGVKRSGWVASLPQHPRCRHSVLGVPVRFKRTLKSRVVPAIGTVLEWYGLPGGESAFNALALPRVPWLKPDGAIG